MALIKTSAVVGEVSGKVGGNVFARNKGGAYVRNYTKPINPGTPDQTLVRSLFSNANQDWRALTDAERTGWNQLAESRTFKNRLGDDIKLSGIALFIKASQNVKNANRNKTGAIPAIAAPPADVLAPPMPLDFNIAVDYVTSVLAMTISAPGQPSTPTNNAFVLEATVGLPPSKINATLDFRYIKSFDGGDSWDGEDFTADYQAVFGDPPVGSFVHARAKAIDETNGMESDYLISKPELVQSS